MKDLKKEIAEWISTYCVNRKEKPDDLPEASILEIKDFLLKDGFSQEDIDKGIENYFSKKFTVWVGGAEVNDHYLTKFEADRLAQGYIDDGYDDVVVDEAED